MRINLLKLVTVCLLSVLFVPVLRAGDSTVVNTVDSALLKKIDSSVTSMNGKVDSLSHKWDTIVANSFSASLADARAHPEKLYLHPFKDHVIISLVTFLFLAFLLFKSFQYFLTTGLSRNDTYGPDCTLKDVKDRSFSYGRVQLFWWTLIILFCFIWFYAVYGVLLPLNPSVVLLLGGGLAVFIFGKSIDKTQIEKNNKGRPLRYQDVTNSAGFLTDILSDDTGVSIHRLQAVAFNVIFGIGFLGSFFSNICDHKYPLVEFEPWQLSLLGISAAGYLGLKTSENDNATKEDRKDLANAQLADAGKPADPDKPVDPNKPAGPDKPGDPVDPAEQPATRNRADAE